MAVKMYKHCVKRGLDFVGALMMLPLVGLAVAVLAPAIYLTDRGPVFYAAHRVGRYGRRFRMYKFRSMTVNSPDLRSADGSTYNSDDDPRVTRIGRFMRRSSLDELPQIFNVLWGDMSFIGPRPILPSRPLSEYDEVRRKRATVRPGITGYSQAYYRNSITEREKFAWDCYYVDHLSIWLDMRIMLRTLLLVMKRDHVYLE